MRLLLASTACLLLACSPEPRPWSSPSVRLPLSEHAVALSVNRVAMVAPRASEGRLQAMEEDCEEIERDLPPEVELEDELLDEAEERATEHLQVRPQERSAPLPTDDLWKTIESEPLEVLEPKKSVPPPALLPEPLRLPDYMLEPAVLSISLDQLSWMGAEVAKLNNGVLVGATDKLHYEPLVRAVTSSVDATRRALKTCGDTSWPGGPAALLVVDARVPVATFNRAVYNLSLAGVEAFAIAVHDPTPAPSRLLAPVGGGERIGTLKVTQSELSWESRAAVHGEDLRDRPPPEELRQAVYPSAARLPARLGEARPPAVDLLVDTQAPLARLIATIDALAASKTYCVALGLGGDASSTAPPPKAGPSKRLELDVRETVAAHLVGTPHASLGSTRIDGSRCRRSWRLRTEKVSDLPERTKSGSLEEALRGSGLEDLVEGAMESRPGEEADTAFEAPLGGPSFKTRPLDGP